MKKYLNGLALAAATLCGSLPAQAIMVTMTPNPAAVAVGSPVSVDVVVSGLTAASEAVTGYDLRILYNTAFVDVDSFTQHLTPFGDPDLFAAFDTSTDGEISFDLVSFLDDVDLDALQVDSVTLATISFLGMADGASQVTWAAGSPDYDRNLTGLLGSDLLAPSLNTGFSGTCIAVGTGSCDNNNVPEPGSYGLAAIALLAAGAAGRSRRRKTLA
jgi:hypothetical protein